MVDTPTDDTHRLQQLSKDLLGNAYRLQVAAAVDECGDDELYPEAVAARAGLKDARAGEQMRHFMDAGMLEQLPKDGRRQPYRKKETSYWELCRRLRDEAK
jgi:hypothetical protein